MKTTSFNVKVEYDKEEWDAGGWLIHPEIEWLITQYGSSIGDDALWNESFDYDRSSPGKLLSVYNFKKSEDAMMFALRWA